MPEALQSKYFAEFDGLRALLAWWLVLGHVATKVGVMYNKNLPIFWKFLVLTNIPVDLFIALSGFAIFSLLGKNWDGYSRYILGRIFRIFPVYLLALILSASLLEWRINNLSDGALGFVKWALDNQLVDSLRAHFWSHFLSHIVLLQGIIPDQILYGSGKAFISQAWSLSLEWQFYLVAPLLFFAFARSAIIAITLGVLMIAADWSLRRAGITFSYGAFIVVKIGFFYAGMAGYFATVKKFKLSLACLAVALLHAVLAENNKGSVVSLALWLGLATLILTTYNWFRLPKTLVSAMLTSKILQYFGRMSFVTYIFHVFAIDLVVFTISKTAWVAHSRLEAFFYLLVPTILLTAVFSIIIHKLIEAPFMTLGKRFRANKNATVSVAAPGQNASINLPETP